MQSSALSLALLALFALLPIAACAKSKPNDTPAPATSDGAVAPASAGKQLLCSDGAHRRGDHWKVECNVCRCGADGAILCSEFPCADRSPRDASRGD